MSVATRISPVPSLQASVAPGSTGCCRLCLCLTKKRCTLISHQTKLDDFIRQKWM